MSSRICVHCKGKGYTPCQREHWGSTPHAATGWGRICGCIKMETVRGYGIPCEHCRETGIQSTATLHDLYDVQVV